MAAPAEFFKLLVDWVNSKKWRWGMTGGIKDVRFYAYMLVFGCFFVAADINGFLGEVKCTAWSCWRLPKCDLLLI